MTKRLIFLLGVFFLILLYSTSCGEPEPEVIQRDPQSTAVGGSLLETGLEIVDREGDINIVSPQTTFEPHEDFYFSFDNNRPFGVETVTVKLTCSDNEQLIAENEYPVDPEWSTINDMIWFGSPGLYKITIIVGESERATHEVIIEQDDSH